MGANTFTLPKEFPANAAEEIKANKVTYRGTGMDVEDIGFLLKIDGKEYFVTGEEFNAIKDHFGVRFRFDAPFRTDC